MKIIDFAKKAKNVFAPRTRSPSAANSDQQTYDRPIYTGRKTKPQYYGPLSPYRSRITNLLTKLRQTTDATAAIDLLVDESSDLSQALWNFIRLSNVGHEMKIYRLGSDREDESGRFKDAEARWREFAARINSLSNAGLDGLVDQLHLLAFTRGAMACEVEVASTLDDIVDVYPVIPQTVIWELEERNGRQVWIPYQYQTRGKVSLEQANFFWVPTDPNVDDPRGRLILKPALAALDFQIQVLTDLQQVIHNQGWPRYDISILTERLMQLMPPDVKADAQKQRKWMKEHIEWVTEMFESLEPDDSFIHFDDTQVDMGKGAVNSGRGLDVRAVQEMLDVQMLTAAKQVNVMMGRVNSSTESWGTVQFRIFVSGLMSIQRGSKRLVEEICRLWLRVHGIQGVPVFTHNLIDYESEKQRVAIKNQWAAFYKVAQLMGWIDGHEAANELFGHDAVGEPRTQGGDDDDIQDNGDDTSNAGGND